MKDINNNLCQEDINTEVTVGDLKFKNPVLAASGTASFGLELNQYYNLAKLGGLCTTAVTWEERRGNLPPRVAETSSGMLNAVGLQNPGIHAFVKEILPQMQDLGCQIIVNIAGSSLDDYRRVVEILADENISAVELNLSCPNVSTGCMAIGTEPELIRQFVSSCKELTDKALWVKLTPNITSIADAAVAAEEAGADALVLINTLMGMAVDLETERPILRNNTGGLSGPAIKPVALRMIQEAYQSVSIPIVGVGGISSAEDALEFMLCGASAVEVGTALMIDPDLLFQMPEQMAAIAAKKGYDNLARYTGKLNLWD